MISSKGRGMHGRTNRINGSNYNKTFNVNVCIILVYTNKYSQYILVDETDLCLHITFSFHIPYLFIILS